MYTSKSWYGPTQKGLTMTVMAGTCVFTSTKPSRPFVLCDVGDGVFVPLSEMAHSFVEGIRVDSDARRITFAMDRLSPKLRRAIIGLRMPGRYDFTHGPVTLQLALPSGESVKTMIPEQLNTMYSYALVGLVSKIGSAWRYTALRKPQFYPNKQELAKDHPVSVWWLRSM